MESLNSRTFPLLMQANPSQMNGSENANEIDTRYRIASPAIGATPSTTLASVRDSGEYSVYATANGIARPQPKRSSTVSTFGSNRSSQPTPTPLSSMKKRNATSAATSSTNGRLNKIIADLYLLAGRTGDAVQWYRVANRSSRPKKRLMMVDHSAQVHRVSTPSQRSSRRRMERIRHRRDVRR